MSTVEHGDSTMPRDSKAGKLIRQALVLGLAAVAIVGAGVGISRGIRGIIEATAIDDDASVPTTTVRRGNVTVTVPARGELQGGGAEILITPMTGAEEMAVIYLRDSGEAVAAGDVVVEFDTSQQEFEIREAEADLLEARQEVIQAEAEARAALEDARYQVFATETEVRIAEQEMRKNEVLSGIQRRENEIALERARNRHRQAVLGLENREASSDAAIRLKRTAVDEAVRLAAAARDEMEALTLRARTGGFVQRLENRNGQNVFFTGMTLPEYRAGDAARPGQAVAQIPDMSRWEVSAQIPEADRGHLEAGQAVSVLPAAVPGRELAGHITVLGGSTGSAWNRTFNVRIALDESDPGLRPGMSADILITVDVLDDVLWVPSQALFESDGRTFVYRRRPEGFVTEDVTLIRRSESQAVITGIEEGAVVALARPGRPAEGASQGGVLEALPR